MTYCDKANLRLYSIKASTKCDAVGTISEFTNACILIDCHYGCNLTLVATIKAIVTTLETVAKPGQLTRG